MGSGSGGRVLVKVIVGHESVVLEKPTLNNHQFRWTLFIRPVPPAKFTDRSFVSKVECELHPTFVNPLRVIKEPPFEITETGYASFTVKLIVHFNSPNSKPFIFMYDMNLTLEKRGYHEQEMVFAMNDVSSSFMELVKKYCGGEKKKKRDSLIAPSTTIVKKRKLEDERSSRESSVGPKDLKLKEKRKEKDIKERREKEREDKKRDKEKLHDKEKKKKTKEKDKDNLDLFTTKDPAPVHSSTAPPQSLSGNKNSLGITPQRPIKVAPNKTEDRKKPSESPTSPVSSSSSSTSSSSSPDRVLTVSELHRRLVSLTDETIIFRVAEILLSHPTSCTFLCPAKPSLSFDLTSADPALVEKLSHVLVE